MTQAGRLPEVVVKRVLLVGRYQAIEPLGIELLAGVARHGGHAADVYLVRDGDFNGMVEHARRTRPDLVAFSVWTGFHLQSFAAADQVMAAGIPVAIGGPHPTYFAESCARHATWVVKGAGFRNFRRILDGELLPGIHFDEERLADGFPFPDRDAVYDRYPTLAASPIKSMMCSVGCPFTCSYCYAPVANDMYGGFKLNARPVDDLIREGIELRDRWPTRLVYMQDDIFGHRLDWLREFASRWRAEVGLPWHCQIRLEMTRQEERLDLFRSAGCTGITLAIESGNDFLRQYVLQRAMPDDLIVDGIRKIQERGFALRTEQILAVPFSDLTTDLETLELNVRLNPEMAWTSILAPYGGTAMGDIATRFGMYAGNNDDLSETFFDRSVLRHVRTGWRSIAPLTRGSTADSKDNPLLRMNVVGQSNDRLRAVVGVNGGGHATIEYLTPEENAHYAGQTVRLHHLFYWLARVPRGHVLAARYLALPEAERTWAALGALAGEHLEALGYAAAMSLWMRDLERDAADAGVELAGAARQNPWYFVFMPSGGELAAAWQREGVLDAADPFPRVGYLTRQWLFARALYHTEPARPPIATSGESAVINAARRRGAA